MNKEPLTHDELNLLIDSIEEEIISNQKCSDYNPLEEMENDPVIKIFEIMMGEKDVEKVIKRQIKRHQQMHAKKIAFLIPIRDKLQRMKNELRKEK